MAEARTLALRLGQAVEVVHVRQASRPVVWAPDPGARSWLAAVGIGEPELTVR